ncbi:MAG: HepT-like ribonuclease domain-containing protein [Ginsengibacter sp.]
MPKRNPADSVNDILQSIEHVRDYSSKLSIEEFSSEPMRVEACLYNVRIIAKAVSKLPEDVKAANPGIPWTLLKETKNKIVHDHIDTDMQLLWNFIKFELPSLVKKLKKLETLLISRDV